MARQALDAVLGADLAGDVSEADGLQLRAIGRVGGQEGAGDVTRDLSAAGCVGEIAMTDRMRPALRSIISSRPSLAGVSRVSRTAVSPPTIR
jgi:hypothetical protein